MTGHHHQPPAAGYNRAFALGIALNLAYVVIEAWAGGYTGSLALLADAGHNLSDVAGLVLAWFGAWAARWQPNDEHTYGWRRASILAALANAMLLLIAMGALAWEAVGRLTAGTAAPVAEGGVVMVVAGVGIVVNSATALLFLRGKEHDLNIRGAFWHMAADALVSAGVVVSGGVLLLTGWAWLDPVTSLLIALVIVWGSRSLLTRSVHLLFDGVPEHIDPQAVRAQLQALPGVAAVEDLHIWALSTTEVALTAHLLMPAGPADDVFLQTATQMLHQRFGIHHVTLQTVTRPAAGPETD